MNLFLFLPSSVIAFFLCLCLVSQASAFAITEQIEKGEKVLGVKLGHPKIANGAGAKMVEFQTRQYRQEISAPAILDQANTEYVLTRDIIASNTAFDIKANHVTLNLNGHTVVYAQQGKGDGVFLSKWWVKDVQVVNGRIIQGDFPGTGDANGKGCNPVRTQHCSDITLAGLHIEYHGDDVGGIFVNGGFDIDIMDNTLLDNGSVVSNRHQAIAAISVMQQTQKCKRATIYRNRVESTRQIGIRSFLESDLAFNYVGIDSRVTNSIGLRAASGLIHHNVVKGRGIHPIGIWPGNNVKIYSNYVDSRTTRKSREYKHNSSACFRMTFGNDNVEVYNNTFYAISIADGVEPGYDSTSRALFIGLNNPKQSAVFHHNLIAGVNEGDNVKAAAVGIISNNVSDKLVLHDNIIASNWGNILLADSYGYSSGFPRFENNIIVKLPGGNNYATFRSQEKNYDCTAILISNRYENGASKESIDIQFSGNSQRELVFASRKSIQVLDANRTPIPKAAVRFINKSGDEITSATSNAEGYVTALLPYRVVTNRHCPPGAISSEGGFLSAKECRGFSFDVRSGDKSAELTLQSQDNQDTTSIITLK